MMTTIDDRWWHQICFVTFLISLSGNTNLILFSKTHGKIFYQTLVFCLFIGLLLSQFYLNTAFVHPSSLDHIFTTSSSYKSWISQNFVCTVLIIPLLDSDFFCMYTYKDFQHMLTYCKVFFLSFTVTTYCSNINLFCFFYTSVFFN